MKSQKSCRLDLERGLKDLNGLFSTLRDPPRPGPAHPREHGGSAAPKSLDPKQ